MHCSCICHSHLHVQTHVCTQRRWHGHRLLLFVSVRSTDQNSMLYNSSTLCTVHVCVLPWSSTVDFTLKAWSRASLQNCILISPNFLSETTSLTCVVQTCIYYMYILEEQTSCTWSTAMQVECTWVYTLLIYQARPPLPLTTHTRCEQPKRESSLID